MSTDQTLRDALLFALARVDVEDRDQATVALAMSYAAAIDANPASLADFGHRYLRALDALMLTPQARAHAARGVNADQRTEVSPLDELRARRRARGDG